MRLTFVLILGLSACSQFPELDESVDSQARDAPYPDLVRVETLKANLPDTRIEPDAADDVESRVERLRARAARLKGTVIDGQSRERLQAGLQ